MRKHAAAVRRAPAVVPPRLVNSPTLLTGLLKCGICGAGLTTATGKGGKYRYYKCNTRIGKGNHLCTKPAFPMQKMDDMVLSTLADKVFTADRVQIMMQEMHKKQQDSQKDQTQTIAKRARYIKAELGKAIGSG